MGRTQKSNSSYRGQKSKRVWERIRVQTKCGPTWLCCECGGKGVKGVLVGLRDERDGVGGVGLQARQPGGAGVRRLDQPLVLAPAGARAGPGSAPPAPAAAGPLRRERTEADLVVPPGAGQDRPPPEGGGVGGDVADGEPLGSDDLCWGGGKDERRWSNVKKG